MSEGPQPLPATHRARITRLQLHPVMSSEDGRILQQGTESFLTNSYSCFTVYIVI
jgi:hypothetical protein